MEIYWLIPVSVLIGAALLIFTGRRTGAGIGSAWFIALFAALAVWGWTGSLRWWAPPLVSGESVSYSYSVIFSTLEISAETGTAALPFVLDSTSWPYMQALSALLLILLTAAPSYLEAKIAPKTWGFFLLIEAIGYLAVSANGVRPLIYCWMTFDIIDFVTQYLNSRGSGFRKGTLTAIGIRFIGTLLAAAALALSAADIELTGDNVVSPTGGIFLLIACALRMGILPITQPYTEMDDSRVGLGTMLRLVSLLTVMPILGRVPLVLLAPRVAVVLSIAVGIAALVGALGWILSTDIRAGATYAALAISGMAFACTLRSQQHALIVWGISIVLTCAPLSLYRIHNVIMDVLAVLLVVCFSGLPYTPNAIGWFGLISEPISGMDILFVLVPMLIIAGTYIHILRTEAKKFTDLEPWMRTMYPLGFIIAIGTHIYISMTNWDSLYSIGNPYASCAAFIGGLLIAYLTTSIPKQSRAQNFLTWGREGVTLFWVVMKNVLNMEWLAAAFAAFGRVLRRILDTFSNVLEFPGGQVWEFLLLALILTIAFAGGAS